MRAPLDAELEQGVRRFQQRHGLQDDGLVGDSTLAALNVPVEDRIEQIEVNLERWRWLKRDLAKQFILINIANFELYVVENDLPVTKMRVVVGKRYHATPVFASRMTDLIINPSWNVPPGIAVNEMLPRLREDPGYLRKEDIRVFQGSGRDEKEVNSDAIDWPSIDPTTFPYHFRQDPGPKNALGRLKFVFANEFNVYIHDTPARELFQKPVREFSHGCIRLERPLDLAVYLLSGDPVWTRDTLLAAIVSAQELTVPLPQPIPVYVLYATAWVDRNGVAQFRRDAYGLDELVRRGLYSARSALEPFPAQELP